jgi:hypothetical protein
MTLASRVTDLVTALATGLNARNAPGASDYQMWLAQGNTGTLQDYRTAILGGDYDWAGQFNTALGPIPASGTASETQAGVTQFATANEVLAQTSSLKAVSPANLGGVLAHYKVSTIAALNTLAATSPDGTIARIANLSLGTGMSLDLGTFWKVGGYFYLVGENYATGSTGAANMLAAFMSAISSYPYVGVGVGQWSSLRGCPTSATARMGAGHTIRACLRDGYHSSVLRQWCADSGADAADSFQSDRADGAQRQPVESMDSAMGWPLPPQLAVAVHGCHSRWLLRWHRAL